MCNPYSVNTFSQLFLFGEQENVHIVMFLQSSSECSSLFAEEEHQGNCDVICRFSISNHLEQWRLSTATTLSVIWENIQKSPDSKKVQRNHERQVILH